MKKYLMFVTVLFIVNVAFWYLLAPTLFTNTALAPEPQPPKPEVVDVFAYTLKEEVDKKQGVPIEGYTPQMFLRAFPGLSATDFAGVDASIGYYVFANGQLEHKLDDTELIHSAATAITRTGMATLLDNVAARTDIDLSEDGTITDVMTYLVGVQ